MKPAHVDAFLRDPPGRWALAGTCIGWSYSPLLSGVATWGRPGVPESRAALAMLEAFESPGLTSGMVLILDARRLEVDMDSLRVLADWIHERRDALRARVRMQVGIVGSSAAAFILSGVLPIIGDTHPFKVFSNALEGYSYASPEHGAELLAEIDGLVAGVLGARSEQLGLSGLLRQHGGNLDVAQAARKLGVSVRTLQRRLSDGGSSFRAAQLEARFQEACELLTTTDLKVAAAAARLGISDGALTALFRTHAGLTPAEYRRKARREQ